MKKENIQKAMNLMNEITDLDFLITGKYSITLPKSQHGILKIKASDEFIKQIKESSNPYMGYYGESDVSNLPHYPKIDFNEIVSEALSSVEDQITSKIKEIINTKLITERENLEKELDELLNE